MSPRVALFTLLIGATAAAMGSHEDLLKFTGDLPAEQPTEWLPPVENMSDPASWRDALMKAYARAYFHVARAADDLPDGPESLRGVNNITELRRWKARQEASIAAFVPEEFRSAAKLDLSNRFEQLKAVMEGAAAAAPAAIGAMADNGKAEGGSAALLVARGPASVANTSDPKAWKKALMEEYAMSYMNVVDKEETLAKKFNAVPKHVEDCHTASELRTWYEAQEARIEAFVPKAWQDLAKDKVGQKLHKRQAELEKAPQQNGVQPEWQQRQQHLRPAGLRGVPTEVQVGHSAAGPSNSTQVDKSSSKPTALAALSFPTKIHVLALTWLLTLASVGLLFVSCRWQRKPAGEMGSYLLVAEA